MKRFLFLAVMLCFLSAPLAQAQDKEAQQAPPAETAVVEAAPEWPPLVADEKVKAVRKEATAVRKLIKEDNKALAQSLALSGPDYSEEKVRAAFAAREVNQAKLGAAELELLLIYKQQNPSWAPQDNGRSVKIPKKKSTKKAVAPEAAPAPAEQAAQAAPAAPVENK